MLKLRLKMAKKRKALNKRKTEYYKIIFKMDEKVDSEEAMRLLKKEILNALEDAEVRESKKVFFDKNANQFSIKIPKSIAINSRLNENSTFDLVLKTKNKETLEEIKDSELTIFLKKRDDGDKD